MGTRQNRLVEAVLTSTHNLCFEQKYEKYQNFYLKIFLFLWGRVKFSVYLNRRVFVMLRCAHVRRYIFSLEVHLVYCIQNDQSYVLYRPRQAWAK